MNSTLAKKKTDLIDRDGPWSAHNIMVTEDLYTIDNRLIKEEYRLQRVIQNISDFSAKKFSQLRILDLACMEGLFGIECARQGAEVVFIDARSANLRKVEFVAEALNLDRVEIVKDDVRNVSLGKYGSFDVILCLGILYHLDTPDIYPFIDNLSAMTSGMVIFDTHVAIERNRKFEHAGTEYHGCGYLEHPLDASIEEKKKELLKSIDNNWSFNLTKESLLRMLMKTGFSSVVESYLPFDRIKTANRITILALKGQKIKLFSAPLINDLQEEIIQEGVLTETLVKKITRRAEDLIYKLKMLCPRFIRSIYRK